MKSERSGHNRRPKASVQYFENRSCEYYPCHETDSVGFNCLFCFCPLYFALCPGNPMFDDKNGVMFKNCSGCEYPHRPENYERIIEYIAAMLHEGE